MEKIHQPLTVMEGIALMNDMIRYDPMQDALKEFQSIRHLDSDVFKAGEVGKVWWKGIMKHHGHRLLTKKCLRQERFDHIIQYSANV